VCIFLRNFDGSCRGGRHSYVSWQHLGPVRVSHLAHKSAALDIFGYLNPRNYSYHIGTLRCRHLSHMVQGNSWVRLPVDMRISRHVEWLLIFRIHLYSTFTSNPLVLLYYTEVTDLWKTRNMVNLSCIGRRHKRSGETCNVLLFSRLGKISLTNSIIM